MILIECHSTFLICYLMQSKYEINDFFRWPEKYLKKQWKGILYEFTTCINLWLMNTMKNSISSTISLEILSIEKKMRWKITKTNFGMRKTSCKLNRYLIDSSFGVVSCSISHSNFFTWQLNIWIKKIIKGYKAIYIFFML